MKLPREQFDLDFPDDNACLDAILKLRYGDKPTCPKCGKNTKFHRITGRRQYACQFCGHHVAPCAGTVFEHSSTSLKNWFYAMYLFTASRHGVPAKELERQLGVTYKCAWRIAHQLRRLMMQADGSEQLGGHIEIDETLVGGEGSQKDRIKIDGAYHYANKAYVFGMLERGGRVRSGSITDVRKATVAPIIKRHVSPGSTISTDEHRAYAHLTKAGYIHGVVKHCEYEYVRGIHSTNGIEGFWSRLKNSIRGTHIHVSQKHLSKYVAEFAFRHNHRHAPALMFYRLLFGLLQPVKA
ncbi:MAG: IS1595 family transposase [Gammaproteobacteria bacterium]